MVTRQWKQQAERRAGSMRRLEGEQSELDNSLFYFLSLISINTNKNELVAYKKKEAFLVRIYVHE